MFHLLDGDLQCSPYQWDGHGSSLHDFDQKRSLNPKNHTTVFNYLNIFTGNDPNKSSL